ncbi:MAG: class I SAM-dependent methyltransferase [Chloroflexota bacterium]
MNSSLIVDENLQEFTDPVLYDAENKWAADDEFYLALAQQIGGSILDVACGTGRLTRAIAEAGLDITGLDMMPPMLAQAKKRAVHLDIEWIEADCRTMNLGRTFQLLLMTSHGFQNLLADQDQDNFLERAFQHLKSGGFLAFETRNPDGRRYYTQTESQSYAHSFLDVQDQWIDVSITSTFDTATMIDHLKIDRTQRKTRETKHSQIALRYTTIDALTKRLEAHGFTILKQYGDWAKSPFMPTSPEIITICRK